MAAKKPTKMKASKTTTRSKVSKKVAPRKSFGAGVPGKISPRARVLSSE